MWLETPVAPLLLCLLFFLLRSRPGDALDSLSIDQKTLDKIITPFIIGAVLGEMHNQATKKEREEEEEDNRASAQEQHPVYIPLTWHHHQHAAPPLPPMPLQQQPQQPFHHPHVLPMIPLPFHPHHHHHLLHHHPMSHLHHPRAHQPSITLIPHELVPLFHQHVFEHLIHQMQHPIMDHQHMQGMHSFEIIEKLPIHQWLPALPPPANHPMFQSLNYGP